MGHGVEGRVTAAQLDAESAAAVAATLQALSSPSRLMILSRLRTAPATVSTITDDVDLEQSAVSHQLRLLRMMGLVTATRQGRHITYRLFDNHVAELLDQAVYHAEHVRLNKSDPAQDRTG